MTNKHTCRALKKTIWAIALGLLAAGTTRSAIGQTLTPPPASSRDETYKKLKTLIDVLHYIRQDYVDKVPSRQLLDGALSGMVDTLDPFSQYLGVEAAGEMSTETRGHFGGVGLQLNVDGDWLTVITPIPGTPAYSAGILPSDRLSAVDGTNTKDATLEDIQKKLRGKPGSKVTLTVLRKLSEDQPDGWAPLNFTLTRENIKIESVESKNLEDNIGYLRIIEFNASTSKDSLAALNELTKRGASSLILDLRNNPGGLLSSAVRIASYFLDGKKLIVYTQGRKSNDREEFKSLDKAPFPDIPIVVLVNGGSASAAEIVSGALQDNHRALLIGMRTYGKASVQSIIPLDDGSSLRLTIARYYTPSGRSIQRNEKTHTGGIIPDIVVKILPNVEAKLYDQWDMVYAKDKRPHSMIEKKNRVPDEILNRAEEILKARGVLEALKSKHP
jgi:carboxyl-terminal processing protease